MKKNKFVQGYFKPKNPDKYLGNPTNIIYRSSWELKLLLYLDKEPNVLKYGSEEIVIPYISPIDNKVHRYYVDFIIIKLNNEGIKETILVEVKPLRQTSAPKKPKKLSKNYINEVKQWGVNEAKWKAAEEYCKDRKWKFKILTEKELGIKI